MDTFPLNMTLSTATINEPPHQLRETIDAEALGELADDIAGHGLLQPIGVCGPDSDHRYTIGFGHRRLLAHRLLGRDTIAARVWPQGTDLLDISVAENYFRRDLNPIEDARAMAQFRARDEPIALIARRYRCSPATVERRLALLALPIDVQDAIARGQINASVGEILASIDHEDYRRSLLEEAARSGTSARIANVWAAHYASDRARIIGNHLTVAAIVESRTAFIVYVTCDACRRDVNYTDTRGRRFCVDCDQTLTAALTEAQRENSRPTSTATAQ
jgi:ParB/RepB/Spo0J family partition protein